MRLLPLRPTSRLLRVCLPLLLLLVGCTLRQPAADVPLEAGQFVLQAGNPIGQTFVARAAGLAGIDVFFAPATPGEGSITLHLFAGPHASASLARASLPLAAVTRPDFYRFDFAALPAAAHQDYYLLLQVAGSGSVAVGSAPGASSLDGALYQAGTPQDAQLIFQQVFALPALLQGVLVSPVPAWGATLAAGLLLYVLPGWALLVLLRPALPLSGAEQLTLAGGISLALYPLLLLWTDIVGLQAGALYAWGPVLLAAVVLVWHYRPWQLARLRVGWQAWRQSASFWPDVALLLVVLLVFGVRLAVIAPLDAPLWGDAYQHAMMAQLLVDNGGLFDSWQPYVPYESLSVHFGFPLSVSLFTWLTGTGSTQATLLAGQLLNGLAAISLYPLALRLADGNHRAGVAAVLVAGLLSPLPAMYVNWGRYAQLAGQAVLPVALWFALMSLQGERRRWQTLLLAALTLAGMLLHYYRTPFYYAVFLLLWLAGWGLPVWRLRLRLWAGGLARLALIAVGALLLFLPWLWQVADSRMADMATSTREVQAQSQLAMVQRDYQVWPTLPDYVPWWLLLLTLVGVGWALARRQWVVAMLPLWPLLLTLIIAGRLVGLPGANTLQSFAIIIMLYIPVGLVCGWLAAQLATWAARQANRAAVLLLGAALLGLAGWGTWQQAQIIDRAYILVTRPDMRAMAWIEAQTPPQARFLVEGFRVFNDRSAVGADAGWWIPLLAGRANTMPPQYALLIESPQPPDYTRRIVDLVGTLEETSPAAPAGLCALCAQGISHIYIGQVQGTVGAGATQLFSAPELLASPAFELVYHEDRVYIFALNSSQCQAACPAE